MSIPIPKHIQTLSPYVAGKPIEETEREYGVTGAIKLASNENPLGPSPKAMEALQASLPKMHLYPDAASFYLKRKIAEKFSVTPEEVILGCGSNELIELMIRTFMDVDDDAVLSKGSFAMYKIGLHSHNRRFVEIPAKEACYDLSAMAAAIGPKTRLVYLANPDNPAGTWFEKGPFEAFLAEAKRRNPDTLIVMDEAYVEYVTAPGYPDSMRYRREWPNIVTLRTFSKIYGLAGLRLGYGFLHPTLASYVERARMPFNVSLAVQIAAMAALDDTEHVNRARAVNTEGMALMMQELPKLGLRPYPSQANFILVDFGKPVGPVNEALLRRGLIVRPVGGYGYPNALRITIGLPDENRKLLGALREILAT